MARAHVEPGGGRHPVDGGTAELLRDWDRAGGWELSIDGVPQSYVDLDEPTYLTLPRYVAATRPGSTQLVVDADGPLIDLVRAELGTAGFKLRVGDARLELARLARASCDVVLGDVFDQARVPVHLTTVEHVREVVRVLRPGGTYAVNIGDGSGLTFTRGQVATLRAAFSYVLLMGDPGVLRGRRFGNLVLVGSDTPLPVAGLTRNAARAAGTARVVSGPDLEAFVGGAKVVTDATAGPPPTPPADLFG